MRSDAMAPTAGSTRRQAPGLGRIFRGALAARAASAGVAGSGAPSDGHGAAIARLALALGGCLALLSLALLSLAPAAPAAVVTDRPLLFEFDGSDTTAGAFSEINAVEIDQASGSVYVIDSEKDVVDKFNSSGEAQNFSGIGSSSLAPGLALNTYSDITVDNYGPNAGRLHVTREFSPVKAFDPSGTFLWEIANLGDICGLAVDTEGYLWIGNWASIQADKYANTGSPPAKIDQFPVTAGRPCRLDVDASGNVYINRFGGAVDKYEGGVKVATLDSVSSEGVTVDQSGPSGHLFTLHSSTFNEYDSTGTLIGTFGTAAFGNGRGIAYNQALDRVYVTDKVDGSVKVFGSVTTGTVPDPTIEPPTGIGISRATFNGKVNPQSVPNRYFFQWKRGTGGSWSGASASAPQALPEDSSDHVVSFEAAGLSGNRTYQVRLVTENTESSLKLVSSPSTFTTAAPAAKPDVTIDEPSSVSTTSAEISGTVNPQEDFGTTWRVRLSTHPACSSGFSNQAAHDLESEASTPVAVAEELTGLLPNQHYCARISATNGAGTTESEVEEFVTDPAPPTAVQTTFVAPRTDTTATLNGAVNPQGADAAHPLTHRFEWSADGGSTWTALPDREYTGGARKQIFFAEELSGLSPDTTYTYRFRAESDGGEASPQGEERTFTTRTSAELVLPERGIELVNNPSKGNQNLVTYRSEVGDPVLSGDGDRALWTVFGGAPGGYNGTQSPFLAERSADGWHSRSIAPPAAEQVGEGTLAYELLATTPALSRFVYAAQASSALASATESTRVRLDAHQNQDVLSSFAWEGAAGEPGLVDTTTDASHVLLIDDSGGGQLVDIGGGTPEVVSLMPDGSESSCGLLANPGFIGSTSAIRPGAGGVGDVWRPGYHMIDRADASLVYFQAKPNGECGGGESWDIYLRDRDAEETILVDPGNANFLTATPDGLHAYFLTTSHLDPADENEGRDVYRWDRESGEASCLTCVVPAAGVAPQESVLISEDFSHIYFESTGHLVPGRGADDTRSVYVLSGGTVRYVADASGSTYYPFAFAGNIGPQLSNDGRVLVWAAESKPTADPVAPGASNQVYLYDDRNGSVECVSCAHGGVTTGEAAAGPFYGTGPHLSADGSTVAFRTAQALTPLDVNRDFDVYEWRNGARRLITDGVSEIPPGFGTPIAVGIDDDGSNVLFTIAQLGLTGYEEDNFANLYVARIGGGFPRPAPPVHCDGDSCQGPLVAAPVPGSSTSAAYSGAGNLAARRSCSPIARRAARLGRRAKQLRRRAARAGNRKRAAQLRRRAGRLGKRARGMSKRAKRCRRANRRAAK